MSNTECVVRVWFDTSEGVETHTHSGVFKATLNDSHLHIVFEPDFDGKRTRYVKYDRDNYILHKWVCTKQDTDSKENE